MGPRPAKARAKGRAGKGKERDKTAASRAKDKASFASLLAHPVRVQILAAVHRKPMCAAEFAREHGFGSSRRVAEHFRRLAEGGAIYLLRTEAVRGATRKIYAGAKRGIISAKDWEKLPSAVQKSVAAAGLTDFVVVTAEAIDTGCLDDGDFKLTWDEAIFDLIAWEQLMKMLSLVWASVPSLKEQTELRLKGSGEAGIKVIVGIAGFKAPAVKPG